MKTECTYCGKPIDVSDNIVSSVFCNRICFEAYENDDVFSFKELEEFERFGLGTEIEKLCMSLTC